jgi:6-pyruvoyltetrahydropterin/6-carboxytetrahydropterin synthase
MFRLTREVRFALGPEAPAAGARPYNSYAGFPSVAGLSHFFTLQASLAGTLDARSGYLLNIKQIDAAVRKLAIPRVAEAIRTRSFHGGSMLLRELYDLLSGVFKNPRLDGLTLGLTPFLSLSVLGRELPMVRLSQKFEFCASHRLHNPELSDEQNRELFGKCNNPHGHGHNYEVQITLSGEASERSPLCDLGAMERTVSRLVIDRFDHKNLNSECPEFAATIPSVENIARVIFLLLKSELQSPRAHLAAVTVWETAKTWCEYSE